jgi:hypothetical protein
MNLHKYESRHFTYEFFVRTSIRQLLSSYIFALAKNSYKKMDAYNVDEIDGRFEKD